MTILIEILLRKAYDGFMLTNDEIQQIGSIVKTAIQPLEEKVGKIEKTQKKMQGQLTQVQHDVSYITKTFDTEIVDLKRKVKRLEEHVAI